MEQNFYLSSPEMITSHYGEEYEKYYNGIVVLFVFFAIVRRIRKVLQCHCPADLHELSECFR